MIAKNFTFTIVLAILFANTFQVLFNGSKHSGRARMAAMAVSAPVSRREGNGKAKSSSSDLKSQKIRDQANQNKFFQDQIAALKAQNAEFVAQVNSQAGTIAEYTRRNENLTAQNADLTATVATQKNVIAELRKQVGDFEVQSANNSEQILALQAQVKYIPALNAQIAQLTNDNAALTRRVNELVASNSEATIRIQGLQNDLATLQAKYNAAVAQIDALSVQVAGLTGQVAALNDQVRGLNASMSKANALIDELKGTIAKSNEEIARLNTFIDSERIASLAREINRRDAVLVGASN